MGRRRRSSSNASVLLFGAIAMVSAALPLLLAVPGCETGSVATPNRGFAAGPLDGAASDARIDGPCVQIDLPDGAPLRISGTVVTAERDPEAGAPIANAMISVEYGGLYVEWCDLSKASPFYVFGAVTDDAGRFTMDVKAGLLGFHSFADDHLYGSLLHHTDAGTTGIVLQMRGPHPEDAGRPTIRDAGFDKLRVEAGQEVTFSANVATWAAKDPLSDETVLVEPARSWSLELHPPGRGKKDNFPDGHWTRTFAAPPDAGTYTYWLSATTGTCITSDLVKATLVVE